VTGAEALEILRRACDDRLASAEARAAGGARVVGHFLNSVPIEIILAAGFEPVRLVGTPDMRSARADLYLEEYFDGEVRALFDGLLDGRFAFLDLLAIPRSSEVYLQLHYFLLEMRRWEPSAALPPLYLVDLLQTPHWTTFQYDLGRLRAFADRLREAGGRPVHGDALAAAIRATNDVRRLLLQARALWQGTPRRIDGVDALKVIAAASVLAPERAAQALAALIADPPAPLPAARARLMLKGSPQSDGRFTALVEHCGGAVVAHDHVAGDTIYDTLVPETGDPWEALARHHQSAVPGPRAYPQSAQDARFIALAEAAAVDAVIFFHDEWDDTLGWEYPDQKKLLDGRGIPSLFLKRQPYFDPPVEHQRAAVSAFIASLAERGLPRPIEEPQP
jgi:benzoyl-CoA reductase/2-hydroxyglutaryl-CoA dehydratase subunit BcrC/BadD/HgdB